MSDTALETADSTALTSVEREPRTGRFLPGNQAAIARRSHKQLQTEKAAKLLDSILKHEQDRAEDVGKTWWEDATSRNPTTRARARETLFDRLYEPPQRRVSLTGDPELLAAVLEMRDAKRRLLGEPLEIIEGEAREVEDG